MRVEWPITIDRHRNRRRLTWIAIPPIFLRNAGLAIRSGLPPLVRTNRYNRHDGFGTRYSVTRCGRIRMIRVSLCEARRRRRHGGRMIGPIKMHRASSRPSILPHCGTQPFEPRDSRPEPGTPAHRCIKSPSKHTSKKVSRGRLTVVLISISPSPWKADGHAPDPLDLSRGCRWEDCYWRDEKESLFSRFLKDFFNTNLLLDNWFNVVKKWRFVFDCCLFPPLI